ncbi:MAG: hypothetical protein IJK94_00750 [Bacteroidaceae bacterium]|nr:hypothetical protein [Bacteroidaceae bacterium]
MKRQYIIPSVIVCDMQEMQMVAVSPNSAKITGESTPFGENLDKVSGDNGDAWSSAAVKGSIWDDE